MSVAHAIIDFLKSPKLPQLVGLIGGLAGIYAFIDNYIIKFKPRIFVGTRLIIHFTEETKTFPTAIINSIICSMEVCNHRKKYGVIYDFAVRIYNTDAINPESQVYYASQTANKIPIKVEDLEKQEFLSFSPVTILPSSSKSINLIFSEVRFSKMRNRKAESFYLECYYQMEPAGKWHFIDKLFLYNEAHLEQIKEPYQQYTALDNSISREKLDKTIRPQKTSLFSGITHRYLHYKILSVYRIYIIASLRRCADFFIALPFYLHLLKDYLFDRFIRIPIMKRYGKNVLSLKIKVNNPELRPVTEAVLEEIYQYISIFAAEINKDAAKEVVIKVEKEGGEIVISRYRLSIKIYVSGDTSIRVQEQNAFSGSKLTYDLSLKSAIWNQKYWHLKNYGFISIKSFAIRLLDALIMHSN
jgi:hypothetical protein